MSTDSKFELGVAIRWLDVAKDHIKVAATYAKRGGDAKLAERLDKLQQSVEKESSEIKVKLLGG